MFVLRSFINLFLFKRQDNRVDPEDVVIVSLANSEDGGVVVSFHVKNGAQQQDIIPVDVLYEAVKVLFLTHK